MDSCWKYSELKDKQLIINELLIGEKELADNYYGKFVMRNCNIEHYKKKGCLREESCSSKEKMKKMFLEITMDTSLHMKKKLPLKKRSRNDPTEMLDHDDKELKSIGFAVKKKKLFEDDEVSAIGIMLYMSCYMLSL